MIVFQEIASSVAGWSEPLRLTVEVVLKSSLLLGLALAVAALLGRRSAAARHLVLALGLAGALVLPLIGLAVPSLELAVLPPAPAGERAAFEPAAGRSTIPPARVDAAGTRVDAAGRKVAGSGTRPETAGTQAPASAAVSRGLEASAAATGAARRSAATSGSPGPILTVLLAVSILAVLHLGAGIGLVIRLYRRSIDPGPDRRWRPLLERLRRRLRLRREVTLRLSDEAGVPMTLGLRRPAVVVPAEARRWTDTQRRAVLLHELAHVARWDWPVQLVARLTCAVYWFNPLAWLAFRRLLVEAERACDDVVLTEGGSGPGYARQLLELASRRRAELPVFGAVAMARRATLSRRIQAILDPRQRRAAPGRRQAAAVVATAAVVVLLLAPARLVRGAAEPGLETRAEAEVAASAMATGDLEGLDRDLRSSLPVEDLLEEAPPLLRAAHLGDAADVRSALAAGADPNEGARYLGTPLIAAAFRGDAEMVRVLLDAGASAGLSQVRRFGMSDLPRTPLGAAAAGGDRGVVALLLAAGADPDFAPRGDGTPLIIAARHGHAGVVTDLLAAGADPDSWIEGDESPLFHAVASGRAEVVELLLAAGADPDAVWPGDGSALIVAARGGHDDVVRLLVEAGADLDRVVPGDENPLIQAAGHGHDDVVLYLLDAGADPNVRVTVTRFDGRPEVRSPLLQAERGGHRDIVELLLSRGARPEPNS